MKLQNLNDPNAFIYLERYVNEGSRTYSRFAHQSEVDPKYKPESSEAFFKVLCLELPKEKVTVYLDKTCSQLASHYIQNDTILFPIHPEIFEDDRTPYIKELRKYSSRSIFVAPTASTRTVMTFPEPGDPPCHFIKLHYPRRISRFTRRLRINTIQHCIEVSKDIQHFSIPQFGFLPEIIGMIYGSGKEAWGSIIREFTPRPISENNKFLTPLFCLYAKDTKNPDDFPLLVQLIEFLNKDPKDFTLNYIMKPVIQIWCTALRERGILFEMHGQNTLLELDMNFSPTRVIYRDLDAYIDPEVRKKHQMHLNFPKSHWILENRERIYSVKYDAFIGHHLFDYIASILERFYNLPSTTLQEACKEIFHHYFPDSDQYFSDKTFYYSDEILPGKKTKIIQTNDPPKWR